MVAHMKKTTINIEDEVMERLKAEAARRKTTMGALVEAGIRRILAEGQALPPVASDLPPLPLANLGEPLVDIADREALHEVLDRERDERLYGAAPGAGGASDEAARGHRMLAVAEEPAPYDAGEADGSAVRGKTEQD